MHTRKERKKFPFLRFTFMLISRLFQAGSHACFSVLTLVLVLIAQVGTGLKLSQIMSQMKCRIGMISVQVPTSLCMQNKLIIHSHYCFVEQYVYPREPNIYMGNLYLRDE